MLKQRKNERSGHWFRSERLFSVDGFWYFSTREGVEMGPYETRRDAQIEAGLLRELLMGTPPGLATRTVQEFIADGQALGRSAQPRIKLA